MTRNNDNITGDEYRREDTIPISSIMTPLTKITSPVTATATATSTVTSTATPTATPTSTTTTTVPVNPSNKKRGKKPRSKRNRKKIKGSGLGLGILNDKNNDKSNNKNEDGDEDDDDLTQLNFHILPMIHPDDNNEQSRQQCQHRIRLVEPYPYTYGTFAKRRWIGRSIFSIYCTEFGSYPDLYYHNAIINGTIRVNGNIVNVDCIIKDGDELTHMVHRHEPVVAICDGIVPSSLISTPQQLSLSPSSTTTTKSQQQQLLPYIEVIHMDENIVVVDKPSTLPVHPCGGYNYNTLLYILRLQLNNNNDKNGDDDKVYDKNKDLRCVHRLDRLTSGITILARNAETARIWGTKISNRNNNNKMKTVNSHEEYDCRKVYLARVKGEFPLGMLNDDTMIRRRDCDNHYKQSNSDNDDGDDMTTCYWITDNKGTVLYESATTIQHVAQSRINIEDVCPVVNEHENNSFSSPNGGINDDHYEKNGGNVANNTDPNNTKWLNLSCPCEIISPKEGICQTGGTGPSSKSAQTSFTIVQYDPHSNTTLLLVKPLTGRTHQIRLHLQRLNHPVANDPNYGGEIWYGDEERRDNCVRARKELDKGIGEKGCDDKVEEGKRPKGYTSTDVPATEAEIKSLVQIENVVTAKASVAISTSMATTTPASTRQSILHNQLIKSCVWCSRLHGHNNVDNDNDKDNIHNKNSISETRTNTMRRRTVLEYLVRSPGIWLHSLEYGMTMSNERKMRFRSVNLPRWCSAFTSSDSYK